MADRDNLPAPDIMAQEIMEDLQAAQGQSDFGCALSRIALADL